MELLLQWLTNGQFYDNLWSIDGTISNITIMSNSQNMDIIGQMDSHIPNQIVMDIYQEKEFNILSVILLIYHIK